jgi:hypothetical protein
MTALEEEENGGRQVVESVLNSNMSVLQGLAGFKGTKVWWGNLDSEPEHSGTLHNDKAVVAPGFVTYYADVHGLSLFQEEPHGNGEGEVHKWARVHGPPMRNGPQVCPVVVLIRLPVMHTQDDCLESVRSCVPKLLIGCCAQGQP